MDPQAAPRSGALNNFNSLTGGRTRSLASKAFGALDTRSGARSALDHATDFGSQQSISAPDRTTDRASVSAQMVASKAFWRFGHPIQLRSAPDRATDLVASKAFRHPIGHPIAPDSVASKAFGASSCAQEDSQRSISAKVRLGVRLSSSALEESLESSTPGRVHLHWKVGLGNLHCHAGEHQSPSPPEVQVTFGEGG